MTEEISGFALPFKIEPNSGRVAWLSGTDKLKANIKHILLTGINERVMRRDYGGGLRQLLHDPNNEALRAIAQHQIAKAITRAEPRVALTRVRVQVDKARVYIDLLYTVRRTRQRDHLSVPIEHLSVPRSLGGV
jgi:phage baseplate assembly protein W